MFVLSEKKINVLSDEGFYDYLVDQEDAGKINADDKDAIYQFCLLYLQENLNPEDAHKFLTELNKVLIDKKEAGC